MGWSSLPYLSRPFSAGQYAFRATAVLDLAQQNGWAAWVYSKTAKLNAWSWHGLGGTASARINSWAALGNSLYLRRDGDSSIHVMRADTYFADGDTNTESLAVYAETQWLDFGKPGIQKGLTGLDFDGQNVATVEIYTSADGDRNGVLCDTIEVGSDQGGWTYSGGVLPVVGNGTEFKLRFICSSNLDAQINRLTLYWDDLGLT